MAAFTWGATGVGFNNEPHHPGVVPATGPLREPGNHSGVGFPGCTHAAPASCDRCDGRAAEQYAQRAAARDAGRERDRLMRTSADYRARWLASFTDPAVAQRMAAHADRTYGPMPADTQGDAA